MTLRPFRQILLKLHSRCNLACDHCYVYEHADQSWRQQPKIMSPAVIGAAARQIATHVATWSLRSVTVVLHGGEPLLAGPDRIDLAISTVRAQVGSRARVDFAVQTNGLLLHEPMLELLRLHGVRVGISLDGDARATDRHRRFADGRSSYADVAAALACIRRPKFRHLFSGLLATIDVRNDPIEVYEGLLKFEPPRIDLLLPHGNWSAPPPFRPESDEKPYGDWLIRIFDRWYDSAPDGPVPEIRFFSAILSLLLGGRSGVETVGLDPVDYVIVETDGSIEQCDGLKTAGPGMAQTGLSVFTDTFDAALRHPGIRARQVGLAALAEECQRCPVVRVCGGGLYAHRFRAPNGFRNPSVYCPDQLRLIDHIRRRVEADLRAADRSRATTARTEAG